LASPRLREAWPAWGRGKSDRFLTTHNLSEAERLCGLVAIVRAGKLAAWRSGSCAAARERRAGIHGKGFTRHWFKACFPGGSIRGLRNEHMEVELRPGSELSGIVAHLVGHGAQVEEVRRGKASLEEVFMDLVVDEQAAENTNSGN
jgi:ABC-2 type transport system ATP-binding protein